MISGRLRIAVVGMAVLVGTLLTGAFSGGVAGAVVTGTGITTCATGTGTVTFAHPLRIGGPAVSDEMVISVHVGSCSGGTPTAIAGVVKLKGILPTENCLTIFPVPNSTSSINATRPWAGAARWIPTGTHATDLTFPAVGGLSVTTATGGSPVTINLGTGHATFSYHLGNTAALSLRAANTYSQIMTACGVSGSLVVLPISGSTGTF